MNVASLELCKELYELSGWESEDWTHPDEEYLLTYEDVVTGYGGGIRPGANPAYDLGFLLRKLPVSFPYETENHVRNKSLKVWKHEHGFSAGYDGFKSTNADTPEDAAAKLAIELLKQGILPPQQKGNR